MGSKKILKTVVAAAAAALQETRTHTHDCITFLTSLATTRGNYVIIYNYD